ncbi:MAG: hypothetical protein DPW12_09865 [Rhodocyclaceae bacterium]|nr:hypothetical protein [Rhodocyclaceae bacterium]
MGAIHRKTKRITDLVRSQLSIAIDLVYQCCCCSLAVRDWLSVAVDKPVRLRKWPTMQYPFNQTDEGCGSF